MAGPASLRMRAPMSKLLACAAMLGLTILPGTPSLAQNNDSGRDDTSEFLIDYDYEEVSEPEPSAPGASPWSAQVSFTGLHTTNADQTQADQIATLYGTSAAAIAYRIRVGEDWTVSFDLAAETDFFREQQAELNESRLTATVRASRDIGFGALVLGVRSRSSFAGTFGEHAYTRTGPFVSLRPRGTGSIRLRIDADLRFSEDLSQRRFLLLGQAEIPILADPTLGRIAFTQELRLSRFRAGRNAGRRDLRSASQLDYSPALTLPNGMNFKLQAVWFRNFSNFDGREFSDFEIGTALSFVF